MTPSIYGCTEDMATPRTLDTARAHIVLNSETVNFSSIANRDVIFLGDNHFNYAVHSFICSSMDQLYAAGITHFGIEAPHDIQVRLDRFVNGEQDALNDTVPVHDILGIIRAAANSGLKVIAVDVKQGLGVDREMGIAKNIAAVRSSKAKFKLAILMGRSHSSRHPDSAASRLERNRIQVRRVKFAGGHTDGKFIIDAAAELAGLSQQQFMLVLDSNESHVPYGEDADIVVHLPQHQSPCMFERHANILVHLPRQSFDPDNCPYVFDSPTGDGYHF